MPAIGPEKHVLILCTGNSCRSQMAQAIWQHLGNRPGQHCACSWTASSAGSKPSGYVHPLAIRAIEEIGLPVEGLNSKHVDQFTADSSRVPIDLAVTVCDNAKKSCPVLPGAGETLHWPFNDPADATGDDEQKMITFRRVRDEIKSQIEHYLSGKMMDEPTSNDCLELIRLALIEDIGTSDVAQGIDCTSDAVVPGGATASAAFVAREDGIVCGVEVARLAIEHFAPKLSLEIRIEDGAEVKKGETIAVLAGPAHKILVMERTCLNFMCRLSGIATLTRQHVDRVAGTNAEVLDTRKTLPGWRRLEKYAVKCGGGTNHRMGLYDAVMIKDNHLAFHRTMVDDSDDTIPAAVKLARSWIADHEERLPGGANTILQLEVDTLEQFAIALTCAPDIVLLDNMSTKQLTRAVEMRDAAGPGDPINDKTILLEASGGVNLDTIGAIAQTGVERISVGAVTHSSKNFDIGLDWTRS